MDGMEATKQEQTVLRCDRKGRKGSRCLPALPPAGMPWMDRDTQGELFLSLRNKNPGPGVRANHRESYFFSFQTSSPPHLLGVSSTRQRACLRLPCPCCSPQPSFLSSTKSQSLHGPSCGRHKMRTKHRIQFKDSRMSDSQHVPERRRVNSHGGSPDRQYIQYCTPPDRADYHHPTRTRRRNLPMQAGTTSSSLPPLKRQIFSALLHTCTRFIIRHHHHHQANDTSTGGIYTNYYYYWSSLCPGRIRRRRRRHCCRAPPPERRRRPP